MVQASVRASVEWVLVVVLAAHPGLVARVWAALETARQTKQGAAPSLVTVLTWHLVTAAPDTEQLERGLREIAPWAMAQNFHTRLVAQLCFRRLWAAVEAAAGDLAARYLPLHDCLARSVNPGNAGRITEDWYLTVFHPVACWSLADVLHHFPRLCAISADEALPPALLAALPPCHVPLASPESPLASHPRPATRRPEQRAESVDSHNIQRKITPWAAMMTDADMGLERRMTAGHRRAHEDLVVVASLVDKAPNLGGLCRTCEILGVGGLVLPSLAAARDKEFAAVSVTAEAWVPLTECPPHKLASWLAERRQAGWR